MRRHSEPPFHESHAHRAPAWRSLRYRVVAAFLALLLVFVVAQSYLVWQQQRITRSLTLVTRGYAPLTALVARLDHDRERVETDLDRASRGGARPTTGQNSTAQLYVSEMGKSLERARVHVATAQPLAELPADQAYFNKIDAQLDVIGSTFDAWRTAAQTYVERIERGEDATELRVSIERDTTRIGDEIDTLRRLVDGRVEQLTRNAEEDQGRAALVAVTFAVAAVALGMFAVLAIRWALAPIERLTAQVQRFAAGDYAGRVEVRERDEIGVLAHEFNGMAEALQLRDRALIDRAEELNRLTRYLSSVLDSLEESLVVVEAGIVTLANPSATQAWDVTIGGPAPTALAPFDPGRREFRDASDRLHEVRVTPFGDGGRVIVAADVTEQTRTRDRLARSERLALIGQMLAQITHEVRNPLNALSLNAELLTEELSRMDPDRNTEAWDLLSTVSSEIERLTDVTGHYLQLARRPQAKWTSEDPVILCEDVARLTAAELQRAGTRLSLRLDPVGRQTLDGNQFKQALLNILRNAIEAGAKNLELGLSGGPEGFHLSLRDDGEGMPAELAEKSLDPFFSTKSTGTGLGLAITKQILDDHEGSIRITTTPGEGTTVTLTFPARAYAEAALDTVDDRSEHV